MKSLESSKINEGENTMERYMTFAATKDLTEIIEHEDFDDRQKVISHQPAHGSFLGWMEQHLHLRRRRSKTIR